MNAHKAKKKAEEAAKKAAKQGVTPASAAAPAKVAKGAAPAAASAAAPAAAIAVLADGDDAPLVDDDTLIAQVPRGTRDTLPESMAIRKKAFNIIEGVFQRHGAVAIDTPVFERWKTLMGKYGEDSKLIFDLALQGGEERCSLRYDLTVPFARFIASHGISNIKRYHIARVYRRDQPVMSRGRFREFYQCDFDIAGVYPLMFADSDAIKAMCEILDALPGIGPFAIRLNHRKLLDGMMTRCGVPDDKLRPICSAIDKLDKEAWWCGATNEAAAKANCTCVKHEMTRLKGLHEAVADKLGELVKIKGEPRGVMAKLRAVEGFAAPNADGTESLAGEGMRELEVLFTYLEALNCLERICFDLSLARGLDYYTGVIYEAGQTGPSAVGSIAAGGRYDGLVGMFAGRKVPAVGVSIGIERILTIMEEAERQRAEGKVRAKATQVLVTSIPLKADPAAMGPEAEAAATAAAEADAITRMRVTASLWNAGLAAEYRFGLAPGWTTQVKDAAADGVPYLLVLGAIGSGAVTAKDDTASNPGFGRIYKRVMDPAERNKGHQLGELVKLEDAPKRLKEILDAEAAAELQQQAAPAAAAAAQA